MNMEAACNNTSDNGVNGTGATSESASPSMEVGGQQPTPGRHQATARLKWNKEVNKIVMKCFYKSNPKKGDIGRGCLEFGKRWGFLKYLSRDWQTKLERSN